MSKSTKVIAGLGAVAMLGVAAMPLSTFATPTSTLTGTPENVKLQYDVNEKLSMAITSTGSAGAYAENTHEHAAVNISTNTDPNTDVADTITINTNAGKGYNVTVAEQANASEDTRYHDAALNNANTGTIAGLTTSGPMAKGYWGMKVAKAANATLGDIPAVVETGTQNYRSVAASNAPLTVVSHGPITTNIENEASTVTYGVQAADGQPSGTYTIDLTYTAAVNNS